MDIKNITINVHSSIRITGSKTLYFDPFKIEMEAHDSDIVFITHEHFDHFDPASVVKVGNDKTVFVAPESMKTKVVTDLCVSEDRCVFMNPDDKKEICGLSCEAVAAYNKLKPFHAKGNKWLGYIVKLDGVTYYIAGDTDPNNDNKKVKCDVALVPVGGMYTMDSKVAAKFIKDINPQVAIPTHYGEIVGSVEDGETFAAYLKDTGIQVEIIV